MTHKVLVIPAIDDQMEVDAGRRPENHFLREFQTAEEASHYCDGVGAVYDLVEYEIRKETPLTLDLRIGGEKSHLKFKTTAERDAYKQGLEDGDGFRAPRVITQDDAEFDEVLALIEPPTPKT